MEHSAGFGKVLWRELHRMGSRPMYLFLLLALPVAALLIPWAIFHRGVPQNLPIAVWDQDHSALSRDLIREISANSQLEVAALVDDAASGHDKILSGESYGLLVLPDNFQSDEARGKAPRLCFLYNNQWMLAGGIVDREVRTVIANKVNTLKLHACLQSGKSPWSAKAAVTPLRTDRRIVFNPLLNYAYFLVTPLIPTLLQIIITITLIYAIGEELRGGTAGEWMAAAGGSPFVALSGKVLPYIVLFSLLGWVSTVWMFRIIALPQMGSLSLILVANFLLTLACAAVGSLFVLGTTNLRLSLGLAAVYAGPAFAFGGITFPLHGMPLGGRVWSALLPLTHYLEILVDQSIRGALPRASLPAAGALLLFAFVGFGISLLKTRRALTDPACWGKS